MLRTEFNGSQFVGVFAEASDDGLLVAGEVEADEVADELDVDGVYSGTVGGSAVIGSLAVANSHGVLVSTSASERETQEIESQLDVPVTRHPTSSEAIGNLVAANDEAAVVSPALDADGREAVAEALDVDVHTTSVAGLEVVGSAVVVNDRGALAHPRSSESELEALEDAFGTAVDVGTVNYGTPLVGSGLVANSAGYVAGSGTTGPELGRIEETLGFV
ncbi:MAG: translation initiation factor IF-6 [Halobacteriota archaeon]